ncbi:hypothetical protein [Marinobacter salarius]|uniref:hypothetical protein n=1 Tax=Marinobacter salarius TaxID=1420917 RepID=UPI0024200E5B|nr:hypothetical protein [Marinobacter salarius]
MNEAPETIYLIPGEDIDGVMGYLWCDDPAPSNDHDPAEAVEYVRKDKHDAVQSKADNCEREARQWRQEARTQSATVAEIYEAVSGKKGEPGDWNGAEPVKRRIEELETIVKVFRGCIETGGLPSQGSRCHKLIHELVGENDGD